MTISFEIHFFNYCHLSENIVQKKLVLIINSENYVDLEYVTLIDLPS